MTARPTLRLALDQALADPAALDDTQAVALLLATRDDLTELCRRADDLRARTLGGDLTYVVNRNLDTAVALADPVRTRDLVVEAHELGATEICVQGPLPPDAEPRAALDVIATITGAAPVHLHAFRPAEIAVAATRAGLSVEAFLVEARAAGLGSIPGTGALLLDDTIRSTLAAGAPVLPAAQWIRIVETAHTVGLRSTATLVHGHVETPEQLLAHLRTLTAIQDRTHGFTEVVAMPFTPGLHGPARLAQDPGGPGEDATRALHAVLRLVLAGRIDHVQAAWPKFGLARAETVLRGGADDLGGLLLDGVLDPTAGAEAGRRLTRDDVAAIAARLGRTPRQRTTTYGEPARP